MSEVEELSVREKAEQIRRGSLPSKSKGEYLRLFGLYKEWCCLKGVSVDEQDSLLVYLDYLMESVGQSGGTMPKTLSALKAVLTSRGVDCSRFCAVDRMVARVMKEHTPNQAAIWSEEEVVRFISDAPDSNYIVHKLAVLLCFAGRMRPCDLHSLRRDDFTRVVNDEGESELKISCTIRKTNEKFWFFAVGPVVKIYEKYLEWTGAWDRPCFWYLLHFCALLF